MLHNEENLLPIPTCIKIGWPWDAERKTIVFSDEIQWPKISIVTPSFNQGKYIEETIRSVLLQNYPNLEYIIIDGGSTDDTVEIIKKYESWITYWVSEPDRGQSHAINKGLEKCTGEIFNWLNSDDYYYPDTFFHVATSFINRPSATTVSGMERHLQLDGNTSFHNGTFILESLIETIQFVEMAQPSTFFLTDCFKKLGAVSEELHYIMDGEFWVRYLLMYGQDSFYKINKPLVNFRMHEDSKTVQSSKIFNFLFERSSIIIDIQNYVGLPKKVVDYWIKEVYKTTVIYPLNRQWNFNNKKVSKKIIKLYYLQRYIIFQFQLNNKSNALWGIMQLMKNYSFTLFMFRSIVKIFLKKRLKIWRDIHLFLF
jgi:glycosyltransferase involved in cell wall biosynthesis